MKFTLDEIVNELFSTIDFHFEVDIDDFPNVEIGVTDMITLLTSVQKNLINDFCLDCPVKPMDINEYYMVHDKVWLEANPVDSGMLCISCLENRLGRQLTKMDFTDCPLNQMNLVNGSDRLKDRMKLDKSVLLR
jgi:hypothetical protein